MNCPKCQSTEIDSGGFCLVCGLHAFPPKEIHNQETGDGVNAAALNSGENPDSPAPIVTAELPEWRQELSRRLQEIKSKREIHAPNAPIPVEGVQIETQGIQEPVSGDSESAPPRQPGPRRPRRTSRPAVADPAQKAEDAPEKERSLPRPPGKSRPEPPNVAEAHEENPAADIVVRPSVEEVGARRQQYTQELIDTVVAKLAVRDQHDPAAAAYKSAPAPEIRPDPKPEPKPEPDFAEKPERKTETQLDRKSAPVPRVEPQPAPEIRPASRRAPEPAREIEVARALLGEPRDSHLILLSRTLAGLVDLIIVFLSAGLMVVTVDILEGIEVFDTVSRIHYTLLFLVIYFVYSVFFLGMANQTVGMMLTDLRLTGASAVRPGIVQILVRCCVFLISVAALGIVLLWGCFDGQARCLHDLLSRTRVVRVALD
jgi:uncharacterized RDD family membrane protein YckC